MTGLRYFWTIIFSLFVDLMSELKNIKFTELLFLFYIVAFTLNFYFLLFLLIIKDELNFRLIIRLKFLLGITTKHILHQLHIALETRDLKLTLSSILHPNLIQSLIVIEAHISSINLIFLYC